MPGTKHTTQLCRRVDIGFCSFHAFSEAHYSGEDVLHSRQNFPVKMEVNRILIPDLNFGSFLVEDLCCSFRLHLAQQSLLDLCIITWFNEIFTAFFSIAAK